MAADYKKKYLDIRNKLIEAVDVAFRDGFEQGVKEGQQQAEQEAQQQQMMQEQQMMEQEAAMNGQAPEDMTGVPPEAPMGEEMPQEEMGEEDGSELDQHISELEGMVSKGEKPRIADLRKAVAGLTDLRKTQKDKFQEKTEKVISGQKSLVDGILKKWEKDADSVTEDLEEVIKEHGITLEG